MKPIHEHTKRPIIKRSDITGEGLIWHSKNNVPLSESIYRWSSKEHINLMSEARILWEEGFISLNPVDAWLFENTDIGSWGLYEGSIVPLDCPMNEGLDESEYRGKKVSLNKPFRNSGGGKKYSVYVKNPSTGNIKKISFGDVHGGLTAKVSNAKARKSFAARHQCDKKTDKTKAGYWACRINRYGYLWGGKTYPGYW